MPLVHVSGFPKEGKLLVSFRNYLNPAPIMSKYWIGNVVDIPKTNLKEMTITFDSINEALTAEEYLNTVPYISQKGHEYRLSAKIQDSPNDDEYSSRSNYDRYEEEQSRRSRSREYSNERYGSSSYSNYRDRSRSPINDPSKLDLEIELLRKKRLLIEEERRLILEQKKLEMIKEYGVKACEEIDACTTKEFGGGSSTLFRGTVSKEFVRDQQARDKLLRPQWRDEPADRARAPPPEQRALAHIPQFVLPCKIILKQMKKAMIRNSPENHERNVLRKMIAANLRRRFAIILENKSYMPSDAIARLYRQVYPSSTDDKFINNNLKDVRACHWPKRVKSQKELDKIAKKKAEKMNLQAMRAGGGGNKGGNKPGPSTDPVIVVDVKPDPKLVETDVKPKIETVVTSEVVETKPDPPQVKAELNASVTEEPKGNSLQVKAELNTTVTENAAEDDWAENGVDWNDDDDSKDAQAGN